MQLLNLGTLHEDQTKTYFEEHQTLAIISKLMVTNTLTFEPYKEVVFKGDFIFLVMCLLEISPICYSASFLGNPIPLLAILSVFSPVNDKDNKGHSKNNDTSNCVENGIQN